MATAMAPQEFTNLAISSITVTTQIRSTIDTASETFLALVESIKLNGVLEPLIVMPLGDGTYRLICGERRFLAAQAAGLTEVPATSIPADTPEADITALQITENMQREDLNPMDMAEAIQKYLHIRHFDSNYGPGATLSILAKYNLKPESLDSRLVCTVHTISQITGKSTTTLYRIVSLLKIENEIQDALRAGTLPISQGYIFAAHLDNPNHMKIFAEVLANPVTNAALEKMFATKPTVTEPKPATTLTLTRQCTAVANWTTAIGNDAKSYTRDDLASFREKLQGLCDMVDKKMAGMGAVQTAQNT